MGGEKQTHKFIPDHLVLKTLKKRAAMHVLVLLKQKYWRQLTYRNKRVTQFTTLQVQRLRVVGHHWFDLWWRRQIIKAECTMKLLQTEARERAGGIRFVPPTMMLLWELIKWWVNWPFTRPQGDSVLPWWDLRQQPQRPLVLGCWVCCCCCRCFEEGLFEFFFCFLFWFWGRVSLYKPG